jgi:hypothetical protein
MSIPAAIEAFNGERLVEDSNGSKLGVALILVGVLFVNYFLLVHDGKYKKIAKEFVYESKAQRRKKLSALLIYVTLTFLPSFGFIFIRNL